jgi:hypothetical protein
VTSILIAASMLVLSADGKPKPEIEKAPSKARKQLNLGPVNVNGDTQRAVQVVIPRDPSIKKEMDSASDHLLDAVQRR